MIASAQRRFELNPSSFILSTDFQSTHHLTPPPQSWASRDASAQRRTSLTLVRARALMRRHLRLALLRLRLWPEIDRVSMELDRHTAAMNRGGGSQRWAGELEGGRGNWKVGGGGLANGSPG